MDGKKRKKEILDKLIFPAESKKKKSKIFAVVFFIILLLPLSVCAYAAWGILAALLLDAVFSVAYWFFKLYDAGTKSTAAGLLISALLAVLMVLRLIDGDFNRIQYTNRIDNILFFICAVLTVFFAFNTVFSLIISCRKDEGTDILSAGRLALSVSAFLLTVKIYLPLDTFVNNIGYFNFALQDFIFVLIAEFTLFLLLSFYLGLILKRKAVYVLSTLMLGLTAAVFVQYNFMNGNLELVIGVEPEWDKYTGFGILNAAVWVIILALPFIAGIIFKKHREKITAFASGFITAVQLVSVIIIALFSGENIYGYRNSIMPDGSVQYDVAPGKNIVTFVFDATDNVYFRQLLEECPEAFDGLEDFTLYTNTCSKYSYTYASLNQMLTGTDKESFSSDEWTEDAWYSDKAQNFYKRLHQEGYTVNGFVDDDTDWRLMDGCYDNTDYNMKPARVDSLLLALDLDRMSFYRYAPFFLKRAADAIHINCNSHVYYENQFKFYDGDYLASLSLSKRDDWENCFLVQHLFGTHPPCGDVIAETKNCLNIVKEYIRQLKELGVYDESVIIVTADHGRYEYTHFDNQASTPIFMIKEAGNDFDEMKISSAPVYHTDFLSTCLVNAGIYTDSDRDVYGSSIYDFDENSQRVRQWKLNVYDEEKESVWTTFEYTGDAEELKRIVWEYNEKHPIF